MEIGGESDKELFNFVTRLREGFGIGDRCSQLKIHSQEQWDEAIAKVLTKERELIGRLPKSGLYLNIIKHLLGRTGSKKLFISCSLITFILSGNYYNLEFFLNQNIH